MENRFGYDRPDDDTITVNEEDLRDALKDYYGTAMANGFPAAVIDLGRVDAMDAEELAEEAVKNGLL